MALAYLREEDELQHRNHLFWYPRWPIFVVSVKYEYEQTNHYSLLKTCWKAAKSNDFNWIVFMLLDSFLLELPKIYYLHYRKR